MDLDLTRRSAFATQEIKWRVDQPCFRNSDVNGQGFRRHCRGRDRAGPLS